jgi:hypothetical protein
VGIEKGKGQTLTGYHVGDDGSNSMSSHEKCCEGLYKVLPGLKNQNFSRTFHLMMAKFPLCNREASIAERPKELGDDIPEASYHINCDMH